MNRFAFVEKIMHYACEKKNSGGAWPPPDGVRLVFHDDSDTVTEYAGSDSCHDAPGTLLTAYAVSLALSPN